MPGAFIISFLNNMILKILYPILLLILFSSLFFGLGEQILYAKSGMGRILPFVLIFGGIPFLTYKTFSFLITKKRASNIAALSILILGPTFGLWTRYIAENDFKKYGKITTGRIIDREWTIANRRGRWTITAEFEYKSKKYITFSKDDNEDIYRLNDPISIRFSTRNPENNELILK